MVNDLFNSIARLSIKMRIYRAIQMAENDADDLKEREVLILELLNIQGAMSMTELSHFFPGVKQSALSMDIKRLRSDLDLIDMSVSKTDMRVHLIELSGRGKKKVKEIKAQRAKSYLPLAAAIGQDPEHIHLLNQIVNKAVELVNIEINNYAESKKAN
ncbi:MAG: MarR family winged helix-turn-helix transcriptional regulator [Thermodesulfobacteriota bacterium]